jgi:tetratricopeptide (TPR) repeat protein
MYFTSAELSSFRDAYNLSVKPGFLRAVAQDIGDTLIHHPLFFRQFGFYWWAVKRMLKTYYRPEYRDSGRPWFLGSYRDRDMERNALFRTPSGRADIRSTWLAGLSYMSVNTAFSRFPVGSELNEHLWEDSTGEAHFRRVYDEDLPVQPDLFEVAEDEHDRQGTLELEGDVCVYIPGTWYNHGNRCLELGRYHEAAACFRKYVALARANEDRIQGWLCVGLAYDGAGHFPKAIACYRRCYAVEQEPWVLENIASSYERMGDLVRAKQYYEEALSGMPGNPVIAHSLKAVSARLRTAQ